MHFAKQITPVLKSLLKRVASYMNNTSQCINDSRNYIGMLHHYEELNLATYVEGKEEKMVFGNSQNSTTSAEATKDSVSKLVESLKNPYFNIYHWVKGELYDIEAVYNALATREFIQERVGKREKKKKNTQENLENVREGRMTVKTLFKGTNDVGAMTIKIENTEKEIEMLSILADIVGIYLGETIIPVFKEKRIGQYKKILQ